MTLGILLIIISFGIGFKLGNWMTERAMLRHIYRWFDENRGIVEEVNQWFDEGKVTEEKM